MRVLILLLAFTSSAFAQELVKFEQLIGKTYEVESIKVRAKNKNLKKSILGTKSIRIQKDEVRGDIALTIETHDNADLVNRDLFDLLADKDHVLGINYKKSKNNIIWCEEEETKIKEKENKLKSKYLDAGYFLCVGMLGGKNSKSKVTIKKEGEKLIIKSMYKVYTDLHKRHKYRKRAEIILK